MYIWKTTSTRIVSSEKCTYKIDKTRQNKTTWIKKLKEISTLTVCFSLWNIEWEWVGTHWAKNICLWYAHAHAHAFYSQLPIFLSYFMWVCLFKQEEWKYRQKHSLARANSDEKTETIGGKQVECGTNEKLNDSQTITPTISTGT